jgi:hypothetical protein
MGALPQRIPPTPCPRKRGHMHTLHSHPHSTSALQTQRRHARAPLYHKLWCYHEAGRRQGRHLRLKRDGFRCGGSPAESLSPSPAATASRVRMRERKRENERASERERARERERERERVCVCVCVCVRAHWGCMHALIPSPARSRPPRTHLSKVADALYNIPLDPGARPVFVTSFRGNINKFLLKLEIMFAPCRSKQNELPLHNKDARTIMRS